MKASRVARYFSRSAASYAAAAFIQNDLARQLAEGIRLLPGECVLDVGCGSGLLCKHIQHNGAMVVGTDFAEGMLRQAAGDFSGASVPFWVCADAAVLPFGSEVFSRVLSSSALQWLDDQSGAFSEARRVLKPAGELRAVYFCRETLAELFESLESAARAAGRDFRVRRLGTVDQAEQAVRQAGFTCVEVRVEQRRVYFRDVYGILAWIKSVGANSRGGAGYLGRELINGAEEYYRKHYSSPEGLRVTYEMVWVRAVK